eukprot:Skav200518  [mRNA]  locus=scaffold450:520730:524642:- [translate_table: standard]
MASAVGDLDVRLWSTKKLHPSAQRALGNYRNLHPLRFNGRHIYWNDHSSHLLVFLRLGESGSWTVCDCQRRSDPGKQIARMVAKCRRSVKATYQTFKMKRSLWHGRVKQFITLPLLAGKQFFFNESQSFEELLTEFAAEPHRIQEKLQLYSYQARPLDPTFFMADISMKLGLLDAPPLNLWTLGSYFYHIAFSPTDSPCWGGGYAPQICCDRRISTPRLSWCFGTVENDIVEHCCGRYLQRPPPGIVPAREPPAVASRPEISVQIFLQSYHADRFALLPFVESVERFWPKKWNSKIFVAVDNTTADQELCAEISPRVICIFTPSIPRRLSTIDSVEWSGRVISERYQKHLLQYHYWLADLYISEHVPEPHWVAWFDADVVIHTPQVEELLMPTGTPVLFARRKQMNSMETMSLGLDWVGEFMDSFPQLVRPAHLQHFRDFIQATFKGSNFLESYQTWRVAMEEAALVHGKSYGYLSESEGPQSSFPVFLYHFHHDDFTWALEDSAAFGLSIEDTCLSFRVASHVSGWKHQVKSGNMTEVMYQQRAKRLMQLGERNSRVLRVALLSSNFDPTATWSQSSSVHCLGRDRETMLRDFFGKCCGCWRSLPDMSCKRTGGSLAVTAGQIYIIGGSDGHTCHQAVECFDVLQNTWQPAGQLFEGRKAAAVATIMS